jgi:biopolymer transport protein ExbB
MMEHVGQLFERGGPIMYPLLLTSLVSLTITIERVIFFLNYGMKGDDGSVKRIYKSTESGDFAEAITEGEKSNCSGVKVLLAGLKEREHGLTEGMEIAAGKSIEKMKQGLVIMDTIITMAPLLGILGTVLGIIQSFNFLGNSGYEQMESVMGGIAQALITTATGLAIALITLLPYNYFVSLVQKESKKLEYMATHFEIAHRKGLKSKSDQ